MNCSEENWIPIRFLLGHFSSILISRLSITFGSLSLAIFGTSQNGMKDPQKGTDDVFINLQCLSIMLVACFPINHNTLW
jgi:hypothetical protein